MFVEEKIQKIFVKITKPSIAKNQSNVSVFQLLQNVSVVDESCVEEKNRVFGEMAEIREAFSGWSWEENKLFELALAVVDEGNPERWNVVAAMVGGKTVEDVQKHYRVLVEDLQYIESGQLDHRLGEAKFHLPADCSCSVCWSEEDQKLLVQLDIK